MKLALILQLLTVIGLNHNLMMAHHILPIELCRRTREHVYEEAHC